MDFIVICLIFIYFFRDWCPEIYTINMEKDFNSTNMLEFSKFFCYISESVTVPSQKMNMNDPGKSTYVIYFQIKNMTLIVSNDFLLHHSIK